MRPPESVVEAERLFAHGMSQVAEARFERAADAFAGARRLLEGAARPGPAARAAVAEANCRSELGDTSAALELLAQAEAHTSADEEPVFTATIHANQAVCRARQGDYDRAVTLWARAAAAYGEAGYAGDAATCLHNAGLALLERGRYPDALNAVGRARELLDPDGDRATVVACDITAGCAIRNLGNPGAARDLFRSALATAEKLELREEAARAHGNLTLALAELGDTAAAKTHLAIAIDFFRASGQTRMQLAALAAAIDLAQADGESASAAAYAREAADSARRIGEPLELADALHNLSVTQSADGAHPEALQTALEAFDLVDAFRLTLASPRDRHEVTVRRFEPMLLHGLELAATVGAPALSASLVERAPVAGVPAETVDPAALQTADMSTRFGVTPDWQVPLRARATPTGGERGWPSGRFRARIRAAGGDDAWWWGMWVQRGRLHWAALSPDGSVLAGLSSISQAALEVIEALVCLPSETERGAAAREATSLANAEIYARMLAIRRTALGPMMADPAMAEAAARALPASLRHATPTVSIEELSCLLADMLLPLELRLAWPRSEVRLVASLAPSVAWAPLALATPAAGPHSGRPLIDYATISLLGPDIPDRSIADRCCSQRPDAQLCVTDPLGDLEYATAVGNSLRTLGYGRDAATKPALAAALQQPKRGSGVFVYRGHVAALNPVEPSSSALLLPGEDGPLTAHELLADRHGWPIPTDVVLDACESLGTQGRVEWLGLVPAMMHCGARRVTATLWPLIDAAAYPPVADAVLAAVSRPAQDPAGELCRLQRRLLFDHLDGRASPAPHFTLAHALTGDRPRRGAPDSPDVP